MGRNVWIVKPGTNSKGSGVECMNTLPELLRHCDTMPNRIVQKYIERPLLLFSGRKFDIRQYVMVRSVTPLRVFMFSECYLRLCNEMYDPGDLRNRERHISNWQVNRHGKNVVDGAVASLAEFKDELCEITGSGSFWEDKLVPQLSEIVLQTLRAVEGKLVPRQDSFELYGFDLMVDEDMKMWLLEVNLSPGCEGRTPFLDRMLSRMSKRLVEVAVLGQEAPDGEQPDWVNICDDASNSDTARMVSAAQRTPRDLPCSVDLTVHGQQLRLPRRGRQSAAAAGKEQKAVAVAEELDDAMSPVTSASVEDAQEMCADRASCSNSYPGLDMSTPAAASNSEAQNGCENLALDASMPLAPGSNETQQRGVATIELEEAISAVTVAHGGVDLETCADPHLSSSSGSSGPGPDMCVLAAASDNQAQDSCSSPALGTCIMLAPNNTGTQQRCVDSAASQETCGGRPSSSRSHPGPDADMPAVAKDREAKDENSNCPGNDALETADASSSSYGSEEAWEESEAQEEECADGNPSLSGSQEFEKSVVIGTNDDDEPETTSYCPALEKSEATFSSDSGTQDAAFTSREIPCCRKSPGSHDSGTTRTTKSPLAVDEPHSEFEDDWASESGCSSGDDAEL